MKAKTIRKVLASKFNQFADSIEDEQLARDVRKNTIITGGCIASMLMKESVNDFDIYFRRQGIAERVALHYVKMMNGGHEDKGFRVVTEDETQRVKILIKSKGVAGAQMDAEESRDEYATDLLNEIERADERPASEIDDQKPKYRPVFLSANAITLSDKIQIIIRFYGEPDDIHANYDFAHCMSYWTSWDDELHLNPAAMEALLARELRYVGSKYPLCSIIRTRKFIARGWTINAGQFLKMAMQLNELDLSNLDVLEDQLTGVDAAFFMQLITTLRDQDPEKINAAYITTIIDRIF